MTLSATKDYGQISPAAASQPEFPVYQSVKIYQGAIVGLTSGGYARGFVAGDKFVGVAYAEADNSSGSSGDIYVTVLPKYTKLQVTLTGVAITDIGRLVYASADDTFTLTYGATYGVVGVVDQYVSSNTAIIEIKPMDEELHVENVYLPSSTAATSGWLMFPYPVTVIGVNVMFDTAPIASTGGNVVLNVGTTVADPEEIVKDFDCDAATADVMHAAPIVSGAVAANTPIWWRLSAAATAGVGGGMQLVIRRNK